MRRVALVIVLAVTAARPLAAQSNTAEMLQRAIRLYEDMNTEPAMAILRQVLSPASPFEVSPQQRVEAYRYFGAALALNPAKRDSAIIFFRAAIERDPFVDLDAQNFSPIQVQAFTEARQRTFGVGVRPLVADTIEPRGGVVTVRAFTPHRAQLRAELRSGTEVRRVLFDGENDGLREMRWDGLLPDGNVAPAGRYELTVAGRSALIPVNDTVRLFVELTHLHPPLEDTLASLTATELLPEQYPASAATSDLLRGVGVAVAAMLIRTLVASGDLNGTRPELPAVVAGAGVLAGTVAFVVRRSHRDIPANIEANAQQRAERERLNGEIIARNAERLRQLRLAIRPAGGVTR